MSRKLIAPIAGLVVVAAVGVGLYRYGVDRGRQMAGATRPPASASTAAPSASAAGGVRAGDVDPATGKRVLYWHDPMVPGQRFDAPGRSPFMDMQLVPVFAEGNEDQGGVTVSSRVQQNLGIRTAAVTRRTLTPRIEAAGNIVFNERDQVVVQARAMAFVERLYVRATFDRVARGEPLADLYVPEWVAAQEEFLSVQRLRGGDFAALVDAARQRLRQAGMNDEQIERVEESGGVQARVTLSAPIAGVVAELRAREGMTVMPGETLFRINGLSTVWAIAAVPETQAAQLRPGVTAQVRSAGLPGTAFAGIVDAVLPEVDLVTRTIKARIELANASEALTPGMFVTIAFGVDAAESLTVPSEAVIATGARTVVIVTDGNGAFHPTEVDVGIEADGATEIRRGLTAGQLVVVSGQFLLDSEASLRATSTRMADPPTAPATGAGGIPPVEPREQAR